MSVRDSSTASPTSIESRRENVQPKLAAPQLLSCHRWFTSLRTMNNFQLIENIKMRRALWDNSLWDRIDSAAREVMWEDVAEQMKSHKDIVKTRWKNLKDSYRKLLLKAVRCPDSNYIKWRYFPHLDFIKNIILNTKSKVNDISIKSPENVSVGSSYVVEMDGSENDTVEDPLSFTEDYNDFDVKLPKKRKLVLPNEIEIEYEKSDSPEKLSANYPNDDDLQFLLSLYPHFKQVPINKKLPLRMKIEKVIYEELCNDSKSSSLPY